MSPARQAAQTEPATAADPAPLRPASVGWPSVAPTLDDYDVDAEEFTADSDRTGHILRSVSEYARWHYDPSPSRPRWFAPIRAAVTPAISGGVP